MSRTRRNDSRCAICLLPTRTKANVQLCTWRDGVWLWIAALLCRPCKAAVLEMFR